MTGARGVDVHVTGVHGFGVAQRVDRPVRHRVLSVVRDGDGARVDLGVAAVDRVVRCRDTRTAGVGRAQRDGGRGVGGPARVVVGRETGGGGDRRRGVDVHVAGVAGGLDVAGGVDRPVGHGLRAAAADEERRADVELLGPAVDRVVGGGHAGEGVGRSERHRHRRAGRDPAGAVVGLQARRGGGRGRQVDVEVAGLGGADRAHAVLGVEGDGVVARRRDRDARRTGDGRPGGRAVDLVGDGERTVVAAAGDGHRGGGVVPAGVSVDREVRGLGPGVGDVDPAGLLRGHVPHGVGRPVHDGVLPGARDGEPAGVGLSRSAVDGVVRRGDSRAAVVVGREGHRLRGGAPGRELVGGKAGRCDDRSLRVDLHGAGADRAGVAGVVQRLVLVDVRTVAGAIRGSRHDEGIAGAPPSRWWRPTGGTACPPRRTLRYRPGPDSRSPRSCARRRRCCR